MIDLSKAANKVLSAEALAQGVRSGAMAIESVAMESLQRIKQFNPSVNGCVFVSEDLVNEQIAEVKARLKNSNLPLAGVPVLVKDTICTVQMPTTACSRMLAGYQPPEDAFVIAMLKEAGAIIIGKANCDEFAMGSSNENSSFGPVANPWDLSRVAGGSSGGSAAAVAAQMAPLALGSDTGGSVRQPAALCGVVGLKPTYGYVSRRGLLAYASSLDQIGPIGQTVRDVALALTVIGPHDPKDATSQVFERLKWPEIMVDPLSAPQKKPVALIKEFMDEGVDPDVRAAIVEAKDQLLALGYRVSEVSVPNLRFALAAYYIIATAEASSNLARYDGVRFGHRTVVSPKSLDHLYELSRSEGFSSEVKKRIMLGTFVLSHGYYDAYYGQALKVRSALRREFAELFKSFEFLIGPTSPVTAFRKASDRSEQKLNPLEMYLLDICTISANLAGVPALSMPCGLDRQKLPIGLQIMGPWFQESRLLSFADQLEARLMFNQKFSPLPYLTIAATKPAK